MKQLDDLALNAARVLSKYGNSDWDEWRDLKNSLLKIHPSLSEYAKQKVGYACSEFNQNLTKHSD
jgi:hypothetical protein